MEIILFCLWYFGAFLTYKDLSLKFIQDIGINPKYFPRHYEKVPRFMRRLWNIKNEIPKFILFRLWGSIILLAMGPTFSMVYICSGGNPYSFAITVFVSLVIILDLPIFFITRYVYLKR